MGDEELVVAKWDGLSVVSVVQVDQPGLAATHVYELRSDGAVLGTFATLSDVFGHLPTEDY